MSRKIPLADQYKKLHEIRIWLADKLAQESDREVRDALFGARDSIGLALLYLEEVEYKTDGAYNNE
jgi:hypothetical protein